MNHTTLLYDTIPAPPDEHNAPSRFHYYDVCYWRMRQKDGFSADELSLEKREETAAQALL